MRQDDSFPGPARAGPAAVVATELWGGIECSITRVGDTWRNQIAELGLALDAAHLGAVADLGFTRLRFPVLWETISPDGPERCDWRWHDERLAVLREHGPKPIAGLVHHGSGPHYTNLLDPRFPTLLAAHAARVAQRYPWIDAYTPVNEPLTTARFSGLYGHWYPHCRVPAAYLRALVNQCLATVLAMRAVREINPDAQLIQTEDSGKTYAPTLLQYQAEHENERRWLTFDLLCGQVDEAHPLHHLLRHCGVAERDLAFLVEHATPPDVLGLNHYLTSERWLDHNLALYPPRFHGGNGQHNYADVEAVRVRCCQADVGPAARLREAWQRYGRPIAVTEVHHGCSREEQVRWLRDVWDAACTVRNEGADVRAVTVWSLFGALDWNTLLVERNGHYEPGAFDARSTPPRPTLLAEAARALAARGRFEHPAAQGPGWWQRPERFHASGDEPGREPAVITTLSPRRTRRALLITGATGTLGRAFSRVCAHRGLAHVLLSRSEMDIADPESVDRALHQHQPWAVINTAGYVRVADAEREPARCFRENAMGAATLAHACAAGDIALVTFSSDLVFDGTADRPYIESDVAAPVCSYGRSKAESERLVLAAHSGALVVRTSAFFGPWDRHNFVHGVLRRLHAGDAVEAADNALVSPTYVPDLVHATLDLVQDGERGIWHLANEGEISWFDLAQRVAARMGLTQVGIRPLARPLTTRTTLRSERGRVMPTLESALARYAADCEVDWRAEVSPPVAALPASIRA